MVELYVPICCFIVSLLAAVIVAIMLVVFCSGICNFYFVVSSGGVVLFLFDCGLLLDRMFSGVFWNCRWFGLGCGLFGGWFD